MPYEWCVRARGSLALLLIATSLSSLACGSVSPATGTGGTSGSGAGGSSRGGSGNASGSGGDSGPGTGGASGTSGASGAAGTGGASGTGGGAGTGGTDRRIDRAPTAARPTARATESSSAGRRARRAPGTWIRIRRPARAGANTPATRSPTPTRSISSYTDDNCDGSDGVVAKCVFVSATMGSVAGAGTRQQPTVSIMRGVDIARTNGLAAVCVSGENYNETVTVSSGISIYGGFNATEQSFPFRRAPSARTQVTAPGVVFDAPMIAAETHLEGLTIIATTPTAPGGSTYGVRLGGGTGRLFVRYDSIQAGKGAPGGNGVDGVVLSPATAPSGFSGVNGASGANAGGTGGSRTDCTEFGGAGGPGGYDAQSGGNGSPGSGATPVGLGGQPNSAGACLGVTGNSTGGGGGPYSVNGAVGAAGIGGATLGTIAIGLYTPADGTDGIKGVNGKGGSGGGGGGGGDNGTLCQSDCGGGGGGGGCGGLGGNLGGKGRGGGGSFAVFVAAGMITVTDNQLTTLGGGNGGKGGVGTPGQTGGMGGLPGSGADDGGPGGQGGRGSNGGAGGPGGGGGGGPSICVARGPAASVLFMSVSCSTGTPGLGGQGGASPTGVSGGTGSNGATGDNIQVN